MKLAHASDIAILNALQTGTLKIRKSLSARFTEPFWSVADTFGVIDTFATRAEVDSRVDPLKKALQK